MNKFIRLVAPNNPALTVITHLNYLLNTTSVLAAAVSDIGIHGLVQRSLLSEKKKDIVAGCKRTRKRRAHTVQGYPISQEMFVLMTSRGNKKAVFLPYSNDYHLSPAGLLHLIELQGVCEKSWVRRSNPSFTNYMGICAVLSFNGHTWVIILPPSKE